jgi:hypothetical protein
LARACAAKADAGREASDGGGIACASAESRAKNDLCYYRFSTDNFVTGEPLRNFIDEEIGYDLFGTQPTCCRKGLLIAGGICRY